MLGWPRGNLFQRRNIRLDVSGRPHGPDRGIWLGPPAIASCSGEAGGAHGGVRSNRRSVSRSKATSKLVLCCRARSALNAFALTLPSTGEFERTHRSVERRGTGRNGLGIAQDPLRSKSSQCKRIGRGEGSEIAESSSLVSGICEAETEILSGFSLASAMICACQRLIKFLSDVSAALAREASGREI